MSKSDGTSKSLNAPTAPTPAVTDGRRGKSPKDLNEKPWSTSIFDRELFPSLGRRSPGASPEAPAFVDTFPAHVRLHHIETQQENRYRRKTQVAMRLPKAI